MDNTHQAVLLQEFIATFEKACGQPADPVIDFEVEIDPQDRYNRLDVLMRLQAQSGELRIAIEVINTAYPRDVREAVWTLEQFKRSKGGENCILMVMAQYLSPGARETLRKNDVGYFDASGTLYLKVDGIWIDFDRAAKKPPAGHITSIFSGAREQVIHCLLNSTRWQQDHWYTGGEIAELAQTSIFTVSQTMRELELNEWVESHGGGRSMRRRLTRPGSLLDAWAEVWRARKVQSSTWYLYTARPELLPLAISERLSKEGLADWSLTGAGAANALAPLLTSVQNVDLIVPPGMTSLYAGAVGLMPADTGINVKITERGGAAALFREQHPEYPTWFASPFVQYLDLLDGRGRNKELAAHLRETILKI